MVLVLVFTPASAKSALAGDPGGACKTGEVMTLNSERVEEFFVIDQQNFCSWTESRITITAGYGFEQ